MASSAVSKMCCRCMGRTTMRPKSVSTCVIVPGEGISKIFSIQRHSQGMLRDWWMRDTLGEARQRYEISRCELSLRSFDHPR